MGSVSAGLQLLWPFVCSSCPAALAEPLQPPSVLHIGFTHTPINICKYASHVSTCYRCYTVLLQLLQHYSQVKAMPPCHSLNLAHCSACTRTRRPCCSQAERGCRPPVAKRHKITDVVAPAALHNATNPRGGRGSLAPLFPPRVISPP
jgi:hypothetical protein